MFEKKQERGGGQLVVRVPEAARGDAGYQARLQLSHNELSKTGLVKGGGLLYRGAGGQLVVPQHAGIRTYLMSAAHDTTTGAHHGAAITTAWLKERVQWAGMDRDVETYVRGCEQCQRNKPDNRGAQGLPMSLATPQRPWETICMDFVGPLPRTPRGHDAVMVVVDKLTRYVYYLPLRTTSTAQDVFALLERHVLAERDWPKAIVSDRDSRFTSNFWEALWTGLATDLRRSTAFHPQTDGSTERANRTLVEALRSFVGPMQDDWDLLLPRLQIAANDAVCQSTGHSPFFMNNGRHRRSALDRELEADGVAPRGAYPGATLLAERIQAADARARVIIGKAQAKQRSDSARGRREGEITVGDRVWLSNKNMKLDAVGRARKLEPLYMGPLKVLEVRGNAATLELPPDCRLAPTFNFDLLKPFVDGQRSHPDRPVQEARPGPVPEEDPV